MGLVGYYLLTTFGSCCSQLVSIARAVGVLRRYFLCDRDGLRASHGYGERKACWLWVAASPTPENFADENTRIQCGANFSGYTKKVTASAGLFVIYSVANIAALLSFQDKQAPACESLSAGLPKATARKARAGAASPDFDSICIFFATDSGGFTAVVISCACGLVCAIFLRIALLRRNRSREANGVADYDHAFEDLTDKENKSFR